MTNAHIQDEVWEHSYILASMGVQGVDMINMMLIAVHALKKFLKLSCATLPRVRTALLHNGSQRK